MTSQERGITVDFALPEHLPGLLAEMDAFIEAEIKPLERENIQYFDHRRENARTDWDNGGIPKREWEDLLGEMRQARRRGGLAALRSALAVRRPRRKQHRHGGHPGTPGAQGPRAAQRPAGRVVDRRQLPSGHHDGPVRHRYAEKGVDRRTDHRRAVDGVRADRTQPRLRCHLAGDDGRAGRRRLGHQRRQAVQHRRAPRHPRPGVRPHVR